MDQSQKQTWKTRKNLRLEKMMKLKTPAVTLKEMGFKETYEFSTVKSGNRPQYKVTVKVNGLHYSAVAESKNKAKSLAAKKALDRIITKKFKECINSKNKTNMRNEINIDSSQSITPDEFPWMITLPYVMSRCSELINLDSNYDNAVEMAEQSSHVITHAQGNVDVSMQENEIVPVQANVVKTNPVSIVHQRFSFLKFVEIIEGSNSSLQFGYLADLLGKMFCALEKNKKAAKRSVCEQILNFHNIAY